jgi:hypothetical protein
MDFGAILHINLLRPKLPVVDLQHLLCELWQTKTTGNTGPSGAERLWLRSRRRRTGRERQLGTTSKTPTTAEIKAKATTKEVE